MATTSRTPTLVTMVDSISTEEIRPSCSPELNALIGDWNMVRACTISADRTSFVETARSQSVEGTLLVTRWTGGPVEARVLVTFDDPGSPTSSPVIGLAG